MCAIVNAMRIASVAGLGKKPQVVPFSKQSANEHEPRAPLTLAEQQLMQDVRVPCLLNRALCFTKCNKLDAAVSDCDQVYTQVLLLVD